MINKNYNSKQISNFQMSKQSNFVVCQQTQNTTKITLFDAQLNSEAQEQSYPLKILYQKPAQRPRTAVQTKQDKIEIKQKTKQLNDDVSKDFDYELEREVSMGEIQGKFFKHKNSDPNNVKQKVIVNGVKRTLSEPEREKARLLKIQKQYAQQVRIQEKARNAALEQERQAMKREKTPEGNKKGSDEGTVDEFAETKKKDLPFSQNRFVGQFKSIGHELLKKATQQLKDQKLQEKISQIEQFQKKQRELEYQEQLKIRNAEIIEKQKESTNVLPPGYLKKKEQERQELERRAKINEEREKRRELRAKRENEGRELLGLNLIDKSKLRDHYEKKYLEEQERLEQIKREEQENRKKAAELAGKATAMKTVQAFNFFNSDLPQSSKRINAQMFYSENQHLSQDDLEDTEAQKIVDRKAILKQQRIKRKEAQKLKKKEQEIEDLKKKQEMYNLENTLRMQREQLARKREWQESRKHSKKETRETTYETAQQDLPSQLIDLKSWIDDQIKTQEINKPASPPNEIKQENIAQAKQVIANVRDVSQAKKLLPGNSSLPEEALKPLGVRNNRYGTFGDNGWKEQVDNQRIKEQQEFHDMPSPPKNEDEKILNFTKSEGPKRNETEESFISSQKQKGNRRIINQKVEEEQIADIRISPKKVPGVLNAKEEAARQLESIRQREVQACIDIQRHFRGHKARKLATRRRGYMRKEIEEDHLNFMKQFKKKDSYNLDKFYQDKQKQRQPKQEFFEEESISEKIGESSSQFQNFHSQVIDSYSQQLIANHPEKRNQFVDPYVPPHMIQMPKTMDKDPFSLISIYASQMGFAPTPPPVIQLNTNQKQQQQNMMDKRSQRTTIKDQKKQQSTKANKQQSIKKGKKEEIEEDIEEDIIQTSESKDKFKKKGKIDDDYSSDFQSEHITESIPSYQGPGFQQLKDIKNKGESSSGIIEESIPESISIGTSLKQDKKTKDFTPKNKKGSKFQESIPEEDFIKSSIQSDSIVDEIATVADESRNEDQISEESFLKNEEASQSVPKQKTITKKQSPKAKVILDKLPSQQERIREVIGREYDGDGVAPSLVGSQQARRYTELHQKELMEQVHKYRMSMQVIKDFEDQLAKVDQAATSYGSQKPGLKIFDKLHALVSESILLEQYKFNNQGGHQFNPLVRMPTELDMMSLGNQLRYYMSYLVMGFGGGGMMQAPYLGQVGQQIGQPDQDLIKRQEDIVKAIQSMMDMAISVINQSRPEGQPQIQINTRISSQPTQITIQNQETLKQKSLEEEKEQIIPVYDQTKPGFKTDKFSTYNRKALNTDEDQKSSRRQKQLKDKDDFSRDEDWQQNDDIEDEIGDKFADKDSIEESIIEESLAASKRSDKYKKDFTEKDQIRNARRLLGSEQAIIDQSKSLIEPTSNQAKGSIFNKKSFQKFTNDKFKDLLNNEGNQMEDFLNQIEDAIDQKKIQERKNLDRQLEQKLISPRTYKTKTKDLEIWVSKEEKQIKEKRAKVANTYLEMGEFIQKLEHEKKQMLDSLNLAVPAAGTPRGKPSIFRRSTSSQGTIQTVDDSSLDTDVRTAKAQIKEIRDGISKNPESQYLANKRQLVHKLMNDKKDAIERGLKEKMIVLESEIIDEMLQGAIQLDVEQEVERRFQIAKNLIEQTKIDESASVSKSASIIMPPGQKKQSKLSAGKKNVTFKHERSEDNDLQKSSSHTTKSLKKMRQESDDDSIEESIPIEESMQPSSSGKMKSFKSSKDKSFKSSKDKKSDEDSSLERDSNSKLSEDDDDYSNDFVEESLQSGRLSGSRKSKKSKKESVKLEESGYSEQFDEFSQSHKSAKSVSSKGRKTLGSSSKHRSSQIEVVSEESSNISSEKQPESKRSQQRSQRDLDPSDIEILESTQSVDWKYLLVSEKRAKSETEEESAPSPPAATSSRQEGIQDDYEDEEIYEDQIDGSQKSSNKYEKQTSEDKEDGYTEVAPNSGYDDMESQEISNSMPQNQFESESDFQANVDQITNHLLNEILQDFQADPSVKMVVEDDVDEGDFQQLWPYSLDKPIPEPEPPKKSQPQQKVEQVDHEALAKKKHDEQMQKYFEEQKVLEEDHRKVKEYLDFMIEVVDREVLLQALSKPIEHDPLKVLEKIQQFDIEDDVEITNMTLSQQQSALPAYLFDEIERLFEQIHETTILKSDNQGSPPEKKSAQKDKQNLQEQTNLSQEARNIHHLAIFDAFNEALDQERPYKVKGVPNPWSKQTRVTNESLNFDQVDQIIQKARVKVLEWNKTGAGTKFSPPPPPPSGDAEQNQANQLQENEEERNKLERQERLGMLLTKEVHQQEINWLDYEIEDTQVRFDLADMILEELADEVVQVLLDLQHGKNGRLQQIDVDLDDEMYGEEMYEDGIMGGFGGGLDEANSVGTGKLDGDSIDHF